MNSKIQIFKHIFELKKSPDENKISSCTFSIEGKTQDEWTESEVKWGHQYQQEIFNGVFDWLIFDRGHITIREFGIEISLSDPIYDGSLHWRGGHIQTEMKELCPHCEDKLCDFDCFEALEWATDRDPDLCRDKSDELAGNRHFNYGVDAIESMILTHAMAGISIDSEMYKSGIRAALEGLANNT